MPQNSLSVQTRALSLRRDNAPATIDLDSRSVEVVCATENPVRVMDWETWQPIDEILLMSGCRIPENGQVVLLDSHSRYSTESVYGSCRELRVAGAQLLGRAHFADDQAVEPTWAKTRDGHITDFSVGYSIDEFQTLRENETAIVGGRTYSGPLRLVTRWTVKELSVCPIGADDQAKARALATPGAQAAPAPGHHPPLAGQPAPTKKEDAMDQRLRAFLESRGLPQTATEDQAWEHFRALETTTNQQAPDVDASVRAALEAERGRTAEITAMGNRFNCGELCAEMIREGLTIDAARAKVLDHVAATPAAAPAFRVEVGTDARDKFRSAAEDGLLLRAGIAVATPAPGALDLRGYSLRELARHSLRVAGLSDGGSAMEMVGRAMTTGDLPNILANVANKSLFTGYETAGETWQEWCDVGSVSDFKTNSLMSASETSDLDQITEEQPYRYGEMTDAKEQFSIATYGKLFALSRQTIINDDLGALTDVPAKHGQAAARKVGDIAYAVLTANANMRDGVALFHSNHGNLGTNGVPSDVTIAEAIKLAKLQKDLGGKRRLNIRLEYFIAPATIEGAAEIFFNSGLFSGGAANTTAVGSTRVNPYAGSRFTRVYDARLDDTSTSVWYMAGPKGQTVKVFFLGGQQTPYLETKQGWSVDGVEFKVRIDAGAKAVDWKALVKNP
jgi:hypothetical protein